MPRLSFGGILLRRLIVQLILRLFFRVEVKGWENWKNAGEGVLIAPNYVSFIDPLILAAFCVVCADMVFEIVVRVMMDS